MSVVKVVLRKKLKADGTSPLALRITKDRKSTYVYLGYDVFEKDWDAVNQKVRKSHPNSVRFNNMIATKLAAASNKAIELETTLEHFSAKAVKLKVRPKGGASFFAQAEIYMTTLKEAGKFNRYRADNSKIENFKSFLDSSDIAFSDITVALLERFKHYCIATLKVSERTAVNQLVFVRSIFSQAIKNGITDGKYYPFGRGKIVIKFPETKKVGLSIESVQKIENVMLDNPLHDHARKVWLFSFYFGGMRGSDVLRLRWADFSGGRLNYTMGKNNKSVSLKVPDKASVILNSYEPDKRHEHDLVFPELKTLKDLDDRFAVEASIADNISRLDAVLKKRVAPKAGITHKLTMHIARHSFGNIAGDSIALTTAQKLFRHSDISTTMGYMNNFVHKDEDEALDNVINFIPAKTINGASHHDKPAAQAKKRKSKTTV